VVLTWTPDPSVDYWIFTATDPSLTAFNWTGLANAHGYPSASTPFYMCGLLDGDQYYFAANGRTNGGPGGTSKSSTPSNVTPYNASAKTWTFNPSLSSKNLYGVGYASLTTCSNNPTSAAGSFVAVGAGGAIFTSADGQSWNAAVSPPGLPDLYAVTGNATNLNNPTSPPVLLWVAVGNGGVIVYSNDGNYWYTVTTSLGNHALRSLTHAGGTFVAVGDGGTIASSTDGINWTPQTSNSSNNLNGVTHGGIYVAVGDSGTILTSGNGGTWYPVFASGISTNINLRQVASFGNLYVAVGDAGTIVTSKDGTYWYTQTLSGAPDLVGVAAEPQIMANDVVNGVIDGWLGIVPNVQFVAVDRSGKTYTTKSNPFSTANTNGLTWIPANNTGISNPNALVSSGFGYVAAGNAGATAYAF
jgi:hypothetical protein